ncbi:MAG: hypothetical protein FJ271_04980 [Planctomycetes bacterium]|nr:hypothetical protein [Planctomycetota bacterium]
MNGGKRATVGFKVHRLGLAILVGIMATGRATAQYGHAPAQPPAAAFPGAMPHGAPAVPAMPAKKFMTKSVFYLPVKVDDRVRSTLKEIRLYVKDDPSKNWLLQDKVDPKQTYFTFRAPREGEYWFTVVTVDKMGKAVPGDLRNEAPGVIVVLDSQPPQVEVRPQPPCPEGTMFQAVVRDANPDLTKIHVAYQSGDMQWRSLDPHPGRMDLYCVPEQAVFNGLVRVDAVDLAGNKVCKEFNIGNPATPVAKSMLPATKPDSQGLKQVSFSNPEDLSRSTKPHGLEQLLPANSQATSPSPFPIEKIDDPIGPALNGPAVNGPDLNPSSPRSGNGPIAFSQEQGHDSVEQPIGGRIQARGRDSEPSSANRQVVGKGHIVLDYQIDEKGPSGVGTVEVWMTRDHGKSWQKLCEDADRKSPVEINLPGEGVYGVNLVVSNGRGFGGTPPTAGDAPEMVIEVDATKPVAQLGNIQAGVGGNSGCVMISWNVSDKNLSSEPIDLFYATSKQGPWRPIARGIANSGQHRWSLPASPASEAYVRLVAHDLAGNTTQVESTQPITLDDQSRPRARVTSVTAAN